MLVERIDPKNDFQSDIYQEHWQRYLFAKKFVAGQKVLDVACGTGYGSYLLAQSGAREVVGLDISGPTIEQARKDYRRENLRFCQERAEKMSWPDNFFEVIVSFETIEHIDQDRLFLKEAARVLRPGGLFIISTPNRILNLYYLIYRRPFNKFHFREYTRGKFLKLLKNNFTIVDIYGQRSVYAFAIPYLLRKPLKKILGFFCSRLEKKIFYENNGPEVRQTEFFKRPVYFVVVAKNKKVKI